VSLGIPTWGSDEPGVLRMSCTHRAYVGLGANLGPARATLDWALRQLGCLGPLRASSFYRTEPLGAPGQPWYLNAVAEISTSLSPTRLLDRLLELERRAGRPAERERWVARVLDLDLLLYDARIESGPALSLPHPRFHLRRFVLAPLAELAPQLVDPRTGRRIEALLAELDDPLRVEREPPVRPSSPDVEAGVSGLGSVP